MLKKLYKSVSWEEKTNSRLHFANYFYASIPSISGVSHGRERDRLENYFSELEKFWICSLGSLVHIGHSDQMTQSPTPGTSPTSGGLDSGTVTPPSWRSPALPRSEFCRDWGDGHSVWPGLDRRASRIIRGLSCAVLGHVEFNKTTILWIYSNSLNFGFISKTVKGDTTL